jgi:acyl-Coa thioesterase superfamily protein/acyl-CoA thioesterase superfamily protein
VTGTLEPFYVADRDGFVATVSTRGPWSPAHQHGGPPAALCARALEGLIPAGIILVRLTFDLLRPIPIARVTVAAEVVRAGTKVQRLRAVLRDDAGTELLHVTAVGMRTTPVLAASLVEPGDAPPPPETGTPFTFPFFHDAVGYQHAVEGRGVRGTWGKGPMAAWFRSRVPLVAGETASPLQRLLIVTDSASGVGVTLDQARHSWVNADLTVGLHRTPEGEWLCLDAATTSETHGVGLTRARLWDARGPVGTSLQSLVIDLR